MKRQRIASNHSTSGGALNEILTEPGNSALSWDLIPPELLEMIMGFLLDKEDRTWFNNMRLVNLHWNSVANSMMDRYRQRVLKVFNPFYDDSWNLEQIYDETYWPLFTPKVKLPLVSKNSDVVKEIERTIIKKLEKGGAVNGKESRIGYPKSLYLCPQVKGVLTRSRKADVEESSSKLLLSLPNATHNDIKGHVTLVFSRHLTLLVLHGIEYSPEQLQKILKNTSQLRVLEIFKTRVMLKNNEDFEEQWPLPTLPSLTTLMVRLNSAGDSIKQASNKKITRWLTKPYSTIDQLTHLEVDNAKNVDPWKNRKLEQLKIFGLASLPLEPPKATALLRLSILKVGHNKIAFQDFLSFIQQFSKTLEYLHLDLQIKNFKDVEFREEELPELPSNDIVFPHLKAFALTFNAIRMSWPATVYLIRKFPNLETLHIISAGPNEWYYRAKMSREEYKIWATFPILKHIRYYENRTAKCWKSVAKGGAISYYDCGDSPPKQSSGFLY